MFFFISLGATAISMLGKLGNALLQKIGAVLRILTT